VSELTRAVGEYLHTHPKMEPLASSMAHNPTHSRVTPTQALPNSRLSVKGADASLGKSKQSIEVINYA
jgi:hypothetical protein